MLKALLAWAYKEYMNRQLVISLKLANGEWLERPIISCDDGWVVLGPRGNDPNEPARTYINERYVVKAWISPVKPDQAAKDEP